MQVIVHEKARRGCVLSPLPHGVPSAGAVMAFRI